MPRPRAPCALCDTTERPPDLRVRVPPYGAMWRIKDAARLERAKQLAGQRVNACQRCTDELQPTRARISAGQRQRQARERRPAKPPAGVGRKRAATSTSSAPRPPRAKPAKPTSTSTSRPRTGSFNAGFKVLGTSTCTCGRPVDVLKIDGKPAWAEHTTPQMGRCAKSQKRAPRPRDGKPAKPRSTTKTSTSSPCAACGEPARFAHALGGDSGKQECNDELNRRYIESSPERALRGALHRLRPHGYFVQDQLKDNGRVAASTSQRLGYLDERLEPTRKLWRVMSPIVRRRWRRERLAVGLEHVDAAGDQVVLVIDARYSARHYGVDVHPTGVGMGDRGPSSQSGPLGGQNADVALRDAIAGAVAWHAAAWKRPVFIRVRSILRESDGKDAKTAVAYHCETCEDVVAFVQRHYAATRGPPCPRCKGKTTSIGFASVEPARVHGAPAAADVDNEDLSDEELARVAKAKRTRAARVERISTARGQLELPAAWTSTMSRSRVGRKPTSARSGAS